LKYEPKSDEWITGSSYPDLRLLLYLSLECLSSVSSISGQRVFPLLLILVSCKKTEIGIARRRRKDVAVLTACMETEPMKLVLPFLKKWSLYSYYIVPLSLPFACFCPRKSKAHCDGCRKCKGCVAWPNQAYQDSRSGHGWILSPCMVPTCAVFWSVRCAFINQDGMQQM
jgi:hypothetical protein